MQHSVDHKCTAREVLKEIGEANDTVTLGILQKAIAGKLKWLTSRTEKSILTDVERSKLVDWLLQSAVNTNPVTMSEVSARVVKMIKHRVAAARLAKYRNKTAVLTAAESRLVNVSGAVVSRDWLMNVRAGFPQLQLKGITNVEAARSKKQNEGVVEQHFEGPNGMRATLLDMGLLLEADNIHIKDPRRVIW